MTQLQLEAVCGACRGTSWNRSSLRARRSARAQHPAVTNKEYDNRVVVGDAIFKVDTRDCRPTEAGTSLGDAMQAKVELVQTPKTMLCEPVTETGQAEYQVAKRDNLVKYADFQACD